MYKSAVFFSLLVVTAAPLALAQEAPYSQTLDEQLRRVQAGQPAVPYVGQKSVSTAPATPQTLSPSAGTQTDWPVNSNVQPITPTAAAVAKPPVASNGEIIDSVGAGAIPPLPLELQTSTSGVQYLTGGIGDEELAQLKSVEVDYNVQALMAGKKGTFMSGFTLRLLDSKGAEVLTAYEAGQYFYTRLAPGSYSIEATSQQGVTQKGTFAVPAHGAVKPTLRFAE